MNAPPGHSAPAFTDVVTIGETMALLKPDGAGPLPHATSLSLGIGGAESNFAVAVKRLGTSVTWVGRIGNDSLGDLVLRELMAEGVQTMTARDPDAPTGLMIKERRTMDAVKVWYYRSHSAGSRLTPDDVPVECISKSRLLHLSGITPALSPTAAEAVDHAIDCAHLAGVPISFDFNYRSSLWSAEDAKRSYSRIVPEVDIVFAGDDEAALLVEPSSDPLELARSLSALGPRQAIVKRGALGCAAVVDGAEYLQDAVPIKPVDTVGAGDAFVGGYISELLNGEDTPTRLETAVRTGAFACLVPGDWEGMPRRSELGLLNASEPVSR